VLETRLDVLSTLFNDVKRNSTGPGRELTSFTCGADEISGSALDSKGAGINSVNKQAIARPKLYVMGGYSGQHCLRTADYFGNTFLA